MKIRDLISETAPTIKTATGKQGQINRKTSDRIIDPHGYFAKNRRQATAENDIDQKKPVQDKINLAVQRHDDESEEWGIAPYTWGGDPEWKNSYSNQKIKFIDQQLDKIQAMLDSDDPDIDREKLLAFFDILKKRKNAHFSWRRKLHARRETE